MGGSCARNRGCLSQPRSLENDLHMLSFLHIWSNSLFTWQIASSALQSLLLSALRICSCTSLGSGLNAPSRGRSSWAPSSRLSFASVSRCEMLSLANEGSIETATITVCFNYRTVLKHYDQCACMLFPHFVVLSDGRPTHAHTLTHSRTRTHTHELYLALCQKLRSKRALGAHSKHEGCTSV